LINRLALQIAHNVAIMFIGPRYRTTLLLAFLLGGWRLCGKDGETIELSAARIGEVYAVALTTNKTAEFSIEGNPRWLTITKEGVLTGRPDEQTPRRIKIMVTACWHGQKLHRFYMFSVLPANCPTDSAFAWCDTRGQETRPEQNQKWGFTPEQIASPQNDGETVDLNCNKENGCIVQFHRLLEPVPDPKKTIVPVGAYGHFGHATNSIVWGPPPEQGAMKDLIVNAVNGSKVLISGSVLIRRNVPSCSFWSWSVITQTMDSSNNLFYGPSDLTVFCADDPVTKERALKTVLIVLPVHAMWANAYALPANVNSLDWKPIGAPTVGHECWSGEQSHGSPTQGIRPCDADKVIAPQGYEDEESNWLLRRYYSMGSLYNRLTQPGVSQGSISISPIMPATKTTWDVQLYGSTLAGPGWFGLQLIYERDRKPVDDFNSLTAAITYDFRVANKNPYWVCNWGTPGKQCDPTGGGSVPPNFGIRPLEISLRAGPELAPGSEEVKGSFQMPPPAQGKTTSGKDLDYVPRDLNFVGGLMFRLPIIINPVRQSQVKRPEQLTFAPVAGLEGGIRAISHAIGTQCPSQQPNYYTTVTGTPCVSPPNFIFRGVVGVDASSRLPYNFTRSFLGDRPLTIDFSYRIRWQYYAEPFFDVSRNPFRFNTPEEVVAGGRPYTRITFIAPFSAYLQARATWQRGALPPLFQYVGSEVALGLTFSNPGSSEH
jgi:hypothetical protein